MILFPVDPLEVWAVHCHERRATITLDSSGAPPPYQDEEWSKIAFAPDNDEAEAESVLKGSLSLAYGVDEDMIALAQGAQHADFLFFLTHLQAGDLVGVEDPTFLPIRRQAEQFCQVRSLDRSPESSYLPSRQGVEDILDKGSKVLAITNLHNPSGAALGTERMAALVEQAGRRNALVLSDEVYREMTYGPVPKGAYELGENAVSVSSVTKLNGLRGLRIGWMIGAPEIVKRVEAARLYTSYRLPPITCRYAAEAVKRRDWFRERVLQTAHRNLPTLRAWLEEERRISCRTPDGALMAHIVLPPGTDDMKLGERLLDHGVAVGPGRLWGAPGTVRVTFSCSRTDLESGLGSISAVLDEMTRG